MKMQMSGKFQGGVPRDAFHAAAIGGALHEDCGPCVQITTDMALYAPTTTAEATDVRPLVCGCGQELSGVRRAHCPRCGCCLN